MSSELLTVAFFRLLFTDDYYYSVSAAYMFLGDDYQVLVG